MEVEGGTQFMELREGSACIKCPKADGVFYNPVQEFNRDLSIVVINSFFRMYSDRLISLRKKSLNRVPKKRCNENSLIALDEKLKIIKPHVAIPQVETRALGEFVVLEALAATGLRSIRYANELERPKYIIANDMLESAVQTIAYNVQLNKLEEKVFCTQMEASELMAQFATTAHSQLEVIDIDPYGSAASFLEPAVRAVADGGMICVTCTDVATLCGNNTDACFYKYGSFSIKAPFCHEMALRIVLNTVESVASRHQRFITPLVCVSVDFYVRLYIKVDVGAQEAKRSSLKRAHILYCNGCYSFYSHPLGLVESKSAAKANKTPIASRVVCGNCGFHLRMGGPAWIGPLYDKDFVSHCLKYSKENSKKFGTASRIEGVLTCLLEEVPRALFYYSLSDCFSLLRCHTAPMAHIMCDLVRLGKQASKCHAKKNCIKTNASPEEFWDCIRAWSRKKEPNGTNVKNPHALAILNKPVQLKHNFDVDTTLIKRMDTSVSRYQNNPTPYWGPLTRNRVGLLGEDISKRKRNIPEDKLRDHHDT